MYPSVLLVLLALTLQMPEGQSCPRSCNCYQTSEVHCTFRSLIAIPHGLPAHTRRINLGFNSINNIRNNSLVGLRKLELLMLHSNDLHHLPEGLFQDLKSLQILKLSYNKLREISSSLTFAGLPSLLRLYLDHNFLQHIHPRALLQLPSLRLLRLQGNRLHQLHPHALCTLSLLNTYYFSTLRHLDLSNNSLTTLSRATVQTAPLLETLVLQANPWSCDCHMKWFLSWSSAHQELTKCRGDQCPLCESPPSLHGQSLLEQTELQCNSPEIFLAGRDSPLESDSSEIQPSDSFRAPLGTAFLGLSDEQRNSVDLRCNITHSAGSQDISSAPDLSLSSSSPIPFALSLSLECPVERQSYEKLWRILAYYSETAVHLEREIMLSKAPELAYRYKQATHAGGHYNTGVKASIKARPPWLLQSAIALQLNRAQSNANRVNLIYTTRVSARPDPTGLSPPAVTQPWVLILTNQTTKSLAVATGSTVELPCPLQSSGNAKVHWIFPDGSKVNSPSNSAAGGAQTTAHGLVLQKVQLSNAGIYYCVAQAGRDVDVLPLRLAVAESSVPPSGEQVGSSVSGRAGQSVSLPCKSTGSPTPHLYWMLPDGHIVWSGLAASGGLTVQSNGSLTLSKASQRDAGFYRCIVVNQYGSDFLSMQVEISSQHAPLIRTLHPRGPQSASGRSTKIQAPLLVQEGSGDEAEEDEGNNSVERTHSRSRQPPPNRRYPYRKTMRRRPVKGSSPSRGGAGRVQLNGRNRVTPNKQRIDPKKWADLLAKIRQKTTDPNRHHVTAGETTAEPSKAGKERGANGNEVEDDNKANIEEGPETEGSSPDDDSLKEEGLESLFTEQTSTQIDMTASTVADTEIDMRSTEAPRYESKNSHLENNKESRVDPVTSKTISATNEILPGQVDGEQEETPAVSSQRPLQPQQGILPDLVPNGRPQSPWNSRRRFGQRRRFGNRTRGRPLNPPRPVPNPVNPGVTHDPARDQMLQLVTTTTSSPALLSTHNAVGTVRSTPKGGIINLPTPAAPNRPPNPTPSPSSPSSLPPSYTKTRIDQMTHSFSIPDTAEPSVFSTQTPTTTHSNTATTQVHMSATHTKAHTRGIPTKAHTAVGKRIDSSNSEDLESNLSEETSTAESSSASYAEMISPTVDTHPITTSPPVTATSTVLIPTYSSFPLGSTAVTPTTSISTATTFLATTPLLSTTTEPMPSTQPTTSPTTTVLTAETTAVTTAKLTTASPRMRPSVGHADPKGKPVSSPPTRSRHPFDWKYPGANSIPDSHSNRPRWPASPSLPAAPGSTVLRFRPKIADPHMRTVSFPAEGVALLDCEAQGEPKPSITWTKVATGAVMSIHSRAQRFEVLPNGTLVIHNVQLQDRGTYICSAQSFLGRDRLLTTLDVWTRPPRMVLASYREAAVHQGGDLHLECKATGVPTPLLSWVLPDRAVVTSASSSDSRIAMDKNGTLHISSTLPGDRGIYRCVASNSAGAASASVRLHVSSLPPVIQQPRQEHLVLPYGSPLYTHCSARGAPTPTLRWRIPDGTFVRPSQFHGNLFVLPNGTLHIQKATPKNSGIYECTSSNSVGADKRTVRIQVEEEAKRAAPKITEKHSTPDRPNLHYPVKPSGPKISQPSPHPPKIMQTPKPNTVPANRTSSSNVNNTVSLVPDSARPIAPFSKATIISTSPSFTTVLYGKDLQLDCSVTGNPAPTIIWRTPHRKLVDIHFSFDRRLKVHLNGTLSVRQVTEKDVGDYLCIARNKVADDYRLLRVSVVTKPAKIEPKLPLNQMVSLGKPLKVDCLASGLPDPAVRWSLPDGTMVNSVLGPQDRSGRTRRLTVFDNGTLLVPAVGIREEGEYTCYAENQGGQDTMKVNVKVMMMSPPTFSDGRSYHTVKVQQGSTAVIRCQATGDPIPTVVWYSPTHRVVPLRSGTSFHSQRVMVGPSGSLEVRQVQKSDSGNYTCRATNSAGGRNMVVGLEVEDPLHQQASQTGGRSWNGAGSSTRGTSQFESTGYFKSNDSSGNGGADNNSKIRNMVQSINRATTGTFYPSDGFKRPVHGITTQVGGVISVGVHGGKNVGFKADNTGVYQNVPGSVNGGADPRTAGGVHRNHVRGKSDAANGKIGAVSSSTVGRNSGAAVVGGSGTSGGAEYSAVTKVKQQAVRGQTVILPCSSQGSPPPKLSWLLPGNGVLPAPYYGSRLTVHRNGSLELRGVRVSDSGSLICLIKGTTGETKIQVELVVNELQDETQAPVGQSPVEKSPVSIPVPGAERTSWETRQDKPLPRGPPVQSSSRAVAAPPAPESVVSTKTAALVSILNGETLRLPCSGAHARSSITWTLPSGKLLSKGERGESGQHSIQDDGTLIVQQASVFDRGTYSCRTTSTDSTAVSIVTVPVIVIAYPPRITMGPSPVTYTRPGVAVELPCRSIATPKATVTWEAPDTTQLRVMSQARIYGNRYLSPQGSLVIQNPTSRDTGFYRCTAKNVIGTDTKTTYLHVI
ncbi:matrix-remodeling-associated protein 5-like [Synchiropus picturatus]